MTRICHISPVHNLHDARIFYKQCQSLKEAGYDVHLVIQHDREETLQGVHVVPLKRPNSRWQRWLQTDWQAMRKALRIEAAVYQFHDIEFIPQGLFLRMLGKRVIYDIHEDYATSLPQKPYLPKPLGRLMGWALGRLEQLAAGCFEQIIAERCYASRFPNACQVLNYPLPVQHPQGQRSNRRLLYTGTAMVDRGALVHAAIPRLVDDVEVHFHGLCATRLLQQMREQAGPQADQLHVAQLDRFVPFRDIVRQYQTGHWLAGLAIFPPTINYRTKELTKIFEYMQYGLPIIASDFPAWQRIIEDHGCGFCVDPNDEAAIADAIEQLRDNPELWETMSQNGIRAAETFSWKSQERELLDLYSRVAPLPAAPTTDEPRAVPPSKLSQRQSSKSDQR